MHEERRKQNVYLVDAARSATGKFLGSLAEFTAPQIGSRVLGELLRRAQANRNAIDLVVVGNVLPAGLGQNPAKQVVIGAGLPVEVPAYSVNQICASGLQAVVLGAESILAGSASIVAAGGIESMSNSPHILNGVREFKRYGDVDGKELIQSGKLQGDFVLHDTLIHDGLSDCYTQAHMGSLAENIGPKLGISRQEQDEWAAASHKKAAQATDSLRFKSEIVQMALKSGVSFQSDEGIRRDATIEKLSALKPAFPGGSAVTAGNSSQLADGASFTILMSGREIGKADRRPLAKIEGYGNSGVDPNWYGLGPTAAIKRALANSGCKISDIDLFEINEAFCVQTLGVAKELGISLDRLNVNGGATALGHPLGSSGSRILTTLAYALRDRKGELGVAAVCHGGGGAVAMVIRRV